MNDDTPDRESPVPAPSVCPKCGATFGCGYAGGYSECWCASLPARLPVPDPTSANACLCPACLREAIAMHGSDEVIG